MSNFLRDEYLKNLTLNEVALTSINRDIIEIVNRVNEELKKSLTGDDLIKQHLLVSYVIRFDGKGFRLQDFGEIIRYFQDARRVERFFFNVDSISSLNRVSGKAIELSLDISNANNCYIRVMDDNNVWVDATFHCLRERLSKYKNYNFIFQNSLIPHLIQLLGVIFIVLVSFMLSMTFSSKLSIDNAFAFLFIVVLLFFSNIWGPVYSLILRAINHLWPNISFKERKDLDWLWQAVLSTALVGFFITIFSQFLIRAIITFQSILK